MDYAENLRRSPVFRGTFDPSIDHGDSASTLPRGGDSPVEIHLRPARHDVHDFKLDHLPSHAAAPFDRFDAHEKAVPDADVPVLCEKQVTIIVLLARVCTVYDATPKTFVANVLRLHRLGIIDSIAFLADLGLLPTSPLASSPRPTDFIEPWDSDPRGLHLIPQTLNMSRYARDFDEVCLLGQGGFGQVFKARHKLDGICYAIKQVNFVNKGFQSPLVQNVLREVHCLARCDHPNVNRYYSAWLEPTWVPMGQPSAFPATAASAAAATKPHASSGGGVSLSSIEAKHENRQLIEDIRRFVDDLQSSDSDVLSMSSASTAPSFVASDSSSVDFSFDHSTSRQSNFSDLPMYHSTGDLSTTNIVHNATTHHSQTSESSWSHHRTASIRPDNMQLEIVPKVPPSLVSRGRAAPGMEWAWNLKRHWNMPDSMHHRRPAKLRLGMKGEPGADPSGGPSFTYHVTLYIQMFLCEQSTLHDWLEERNRYRKVDGDQSLRLFRQLVDGLLHVHENGIVHRDLKPSNVFLARDGSLKIGDFGLSKLLADAMCDDDDVRRRSQTPCDPRHTQGVGTMSYASPEQVAGTDYDAKVDSFSLGIILLELFVPFHTRMERADALTRLRQDPCELPALVTETYPHVAVMIRGLVAPTASRWTMHQTKAYLNDEFPHVEVECRGGAGEVVALRQQLKENQERLAQQDAIIEDLRRQLAAKAL
ncbi:PEK protein kinase [Aphanomyces invadans]|uniref:non-specific serine/threonine protein kinase n=1 Tax=Aphanomyces invadans TaxID=157072 RepID=A0A024TET7_9STRA|nr:PEK protein kinase [Aphanomyces invadans]ETV92553.1 PEK protein kinase [Aphanomyces invadans]|eukprot:XP_008878860.1 PEK protein kinase [Aphanomyces invadans]